MPTTRASDSSMATFFVPTHLLRVQYDHLRTLAAVRAAKVRSTLLTRYQDGNAVAAVGDPEKQIRHIDIVVLSRMHKNRLCPVTSKAMKEWSNLHEIWPSGGDQVNCFLSHTLISRLGS